MASIIRATSVALLLLLFSPATVAQSPCPNCGRVHQIATTSPPNFSGQAVAQARANFLARGGSRLYRRVGGHPGRGSGVVHFSTVGNFEGTGMTSRRNAARNTVPTCRPSGRSSSADDSSRRIVGDAIASGADGTYRVRIWGSPTGRGGGGTYYRPTRRFRLFR